jgi:uncharacterized coiled-coil DUF342 family protein
MLYKEILKFLGYVGLVLLIVNILNINPNFRLDKQNEILSKKIDSLQANIDSNKVKIAQLDSVATVYKQQVIEDKTKLSGLKYKADLYKTKYNEEHNRITNLSNDALVSEFTNAFD